MHLRKLILVGGFASALLSNVAVALGLGEVRLNSTLNEPLNAEIKLLDTRGLSASQIIVGLASPADYERNGVERLYFFTEFQFDVQLNHPGGAIVRITSHNPVREPYLNFLVEARWPTGRLLREYTLLMDLPTFADSPSQAPALSVSTTSTAGVSPAREPVARPAPQPSRPAASTGTTSPAPAAQHRTGFAGDTYTVGARDTLWQIALDVRPDSNHSVHQTMLAIQRLNPDAFINGNINLLRQGQVLRVPTSADIQSVARRDAVNEVARQNRAWSDSDMGAQLSGSRSEARAARDSGQVSGSVKLATPSNVDTSSGQGSGDNAGRGRALESQLAVSLEELDKTRSENLELNSRVRDLEDQIKTMERLVEVSNEQLRTLQLSIKQNEEQASTGEAPVEQGQRYDSGIDPISHERDELVSSETLPEENVAGETPATEPAPVVTPEPAPTPEPRAVVPPPRPAKTLVDHVMDNILWVGMGIVALLALIGILLHRRRQKALEEEFASDDELFEMSAEEGAEENFDANLDELNEESLDDFDTSEEEQQTEAETGDVVGEADIYIAYGKLDQAEDMLLKALEREPDSIDIRLKLLEVYSHAQNAPKFDYYYAGLLGVAGHATLARAAELRSQIQGASEFDNSVTQPVKDSAESFDDLGGIDLAESEDALDFDDLGFDDAVPATKVAESEDDLDFSFDLDDESLPLADDEPLSFNDAKSLTDEEDLRTGASSYDLSFDSEPPSASVEADGELNFDLELDDEPVAEASFRYQKPEATVSVNEDDIEFTLDDDEPAELMSPVTDAKPESVDDDLSFDFESTPVAHDVESVESELEFVLDEESELLEASESDLALDGDLQEDLQLLEDQADDFNLDMEMGDLDIAALDQEMEGLDADLGDLAFDTTESDALSEPAATRKLESDTDIDGEEDVFDEALSGLTGTDMEAEELPDLSDIEGEEDGDLDFLAEADEAATKLDLARAYIDMGDTDGARDILAEVAHEGNEEQRQEAVDLLSRIDA